MKYLLVVTFLFLVSCESLEDGGMTYSEQINFQKSRIFYFKDERSGLCFAGVKTVLYYRVQKGDMLSITCVPCDSVKHLISK